VERNWHEDNKRRDGEPAGFLQFIPRNPARDRSFVATTLFPLRPDDAGSFAGIPLCSATLRDIEDRNRFECLSIGLTFRTEDSRRKFSEISRGMWKEWHTQTRAAERQPGYTPVAPRVQHTPQVTAESSKREYDEGILVDLKKRQHFPTEPKETSIGQQRHENVIEVAEVEPVSDSGYASATHHKVAFVQNVPQADLGKHSEVIIPLPSVGEEDAGGTSKDYADTPDANEFDLGDSRTAYSEESSSSDGKNEPYEFELAAILFKEARSEQCDSRTLDRISGILPELLEAFALKLGCNASTQMHRDVMVWVHRHRK
jgi:hypothetical protein